MTIKEKVSNRSGSTLGRKLQKPLLLKSLMIIAVDSGLFTIFILLHLIKAFDTISPTILDDSLSAMGLPDTPLNWIASYLVIVNHSNSKYSNPNSHLSLVFLKMQCLVSYCSLPTSLPSVMVQKYTI